MTIADWLLSATSRLQAAGITTARLDCLMLVEDITQFNRAQLLAHPEYVLSNENIAQLNIWLHRRESHEPLSYIRNKAEFYGREFFVDNRVLQPRPETETIIELLLSLPLPGKATIIDVGTGSGALAITAKLELQSAAVLAIDIDQGCLDIAAENASNLDADIHLLKSNLLDELVPEQLNRAILLCNLPYVPDAFPINQAARHEPRLAIFGGSDGLNLYRQLFGYVASGGAQPSFILTESLPAQHEELLGIAQANGFMLDQTSDFVQVFTAAADRSVMSPQTN